MEEVVVTIKTSESELECLIWALGMVKTIRLPIEPEWKKPYKVLLKDLQKINYKINFGMAIAGHTRNNFFKRFREKVKTSAKRYNRKRERSINHNPNKGDQDEYK